MLMYIAVTGYGMTKDNLFIIAPVVIFIVSGCNHSIADMFYNCLGAYDIIEFGKNLIPTTIGNIIGCNILPLLKHYC